MTTIPDAPSAVPLKVHTYADPADLDAYSQAWQARDAAQTARIAELEAAQQPDTPTGGTVFGANVETNVSAAVSAYGSLPAAKLFDGGSGVLPKIASVVPGKRGQACFKPNMSDLAAGRLNGAVSTYLHSELSAGAKLVIITPWQEPNGELKSGSLDLTTYKNACKQVLSVIKAEGVKGVTMLGQTFTAPQSRAGVVVPDNWILTPDEVGDVAWARLCYDNYNNPSGASKYGGDPYATPYGTVAQVQDESYAQLTRLGYGDNYGISEWNAPWRKNLAGDADHSLRLKAFADYMNYAMSRPKPPKHVFLWTGAGVQFDQHLTVQAERDFWRAWVAKSA